MPNYNEITNLLFFNYFFFPDRSRLNPLETLHTSSLTNLPNPPKQNSGVRSIFEMEKHRVKRSDFFHTEVKVCPQETMREVIASHQTFYTLRGNCQTYVQKISCLLERLTLLNASIVLFSTVVLIHYLPTIAFCVSP